MYKVQIDTSSKYMYNVSRLYRVNSCWENGSLQEGAYIIVTELFGIAVNDFDAKKSARYSRVLVVIELVASGTQCINVYLIFQKDLWRTCTDYID